MSLLADLSLSYEALADDPIEVGIHYGKSILSVFTTKSHAGTQQSLPTIKSATHNRASSVALPQRKIQRSTAAHTARANYAHYTPRSVAGYSQRQLVGAL